MAQKSAEFAASGAKLYLPLDNDNAANELAKHKDGAKLQSKTQVAKV
ncbi:MAG: hypothetical protein LRY74_12635 [Shewanella xiamenensis]|nr:hypothetical protein [Shewanella xiamenensis]